MDRKTALAKIKKCLALGKSSNAHEAAAAMRQVAALSNLVADAFGCTHFAMRSPCSGGQLLVFVGIGPAPEVAGYAYDVLARQLVRDRTAHVRKQSGSCKPVTKTARGDAFAVGWVQGVRALVEKLAGSERDQLLLEEYMAKHHPHLRTVTPRDTTTGRNFSGGDLSAGRKAGSNAQLRNGVGAATHELLT